MTMRSGLKTAGWMVLFSCFACDCDDKNKDDATGQACDVAVAGSCPSGFVCEESKCVAVTNSANCAKTACGCASEDALECTSAPQGPGFGAPFTPNPGNSDGVGLDPDGNLVLSSREVSSRHIWIANTSQGTISKVSTERKEANGRYVEEARYATGARSAYACYGNANLFNGTCPNFNGVDPSRTTVNGANDVFVGNRHDGSVTKIIGDPLRCRDTNGDGTVQTSNAGNNILPWGSDDCVAWQRQIDAGATFIRAMAAQDEELLDGGVAPFVWVGDTHFKVGAESAGSIWKVDGNTGAVLFRTRIQGCSPYGFAIGGNGNLWVSCFGVEGNGPGFARLDTTRCADASCLAVPTCNGIEGCDAAVKQFVPLPADPYGITVDFKQRVWLGVYEGQYVVRYDPTASVPAANRLAQVDTADVLGITADASGTVYAARHNRNSIWRIDGETLAKTAVSMAAANVSRTRGMAVDYSGKVWVISNQEATAAVYDPATGSVQQAINTLVGPYTYSDMTGTQLRLATNPNGNYRHVFEGCESGNTTWLNLTWDASVPEQTSLTWLVRTADTLQAIEDESAPQIPVANVPPDAPPIDLNVALAAANIKPGRYLQLTIIFRAQPANNELLTPTVRSFDVGHSCGGGGLI